MPHSPQHPLPITPIISPIPHTTVLPPHISNCYPKPDIHHGDRRTNVQWWNERECMGLAQEIKAHFTYAHITTDQPRCEYFELKLCLDAVQKFEELPEAICTDWKLLEAEWKKMYPPHNTYLNTARDINESMAFVFQTRTFPEDLPKATMVNPNGP
ncbi:hypothetical protein M422DRAFT_255945 [Sphaerobolus stellatus SS14]|uniref:Uncharacterized protein n=1 Tax=Sphaerobolus stellatus (strain SS14) TaxID=990650 RepID=A0A0C9UDD5_SPHS4|nr:hypothetical protein M422DRAFT_255945 [Sphaerobolus stellatus SS14]